jgi:hypothetical protein
VAEPLPHLPTTEAAPSGESAELQEALRPLLQRVGGRVVRAEPQPGDVPVACGGELLFHVRLAEPTGGGEAVGSDLTDGLARLIEDVEAELGGRLAELPRAQKQHAVRMLEERGAFEMRRSAETVAEALGVTRFTVYNYLNRARGA